MRKNYKIIPKLLNKKVLFTIFYKNLTSNIWNFSSGFYFSRNFPEKYGVLNMRHNLFGGGGYILHNLPTVNSSHKKSIRKAGRVRVLSFLKRGVPEIAKVGYN